MRSVCLCALLVCMRFIATAEKITTQEKDHSSTERSCPSQTGIYYWNAHSWKQMEQVHSLGMHASSVWTLKVDAVFPDAKAPVQLDDEHPVFCSVNVAEQGRDIVILKLEPKGSRRELQVASAGPIQGYNFRYKDASMVRPNVEKQSEQTYLISLPSRLPKGEYIIFPKPQGSGDNTPGQKFEGPTSIGGYDFGIYKDK